MCMCVRLTEFVYVASFSIGIQYSDVSDSYIASNKPSMNKQYVYSKSKSDSFSFECAKQKCDIEQSKVYITQVYVYCLCKKHTTKPPT